MPCCANVQQTMYDLLVDQEPAFNDILSIVNGGATTSAAVTAETAYNEAVAALKTWVPGSPSQDAIEVLDDLQTAVSALPIPTTDQFLVNTLLGVIIGIIGAVEGASTAPATPTPVASAEAISQEEVQADHERATMVTYTTRIQQLVPFYHLKKRALWLPERSPKAQARECWKMACTLSNRPDFIRE